MSKSSSRSLSPQKKRKRAYAKGHIAEVLAATLLWLKGYRIVARRYRSPVGEIDLIATRGSVVSFCEVKFRADFDRGLWSISPQQQSRIRRAAECWLQNHPNFAAHDIHFDVILLAPWRFPRHIRQVY